MHVRTILARLRVRAHVRELREVYGAGQAGHVAHGDGVHVDAGRGFAGLNRLCVSRCPASSHRTVLTPNAYSKVAHSAGHYEI